MRTGVILLSSLMLAGTGAALAQQPGQPGHQPGQAGQPLPDARTGDRQVAGDRRHDDAVLTQRKESQIRSDELVGSDVLDSAGEKIAEVDELLIEDDGRIAALLVSVGGVLGVGGRTVAISWDDANVERARDDGVLADRYEVRTRMTQQQLENAPEFQDETGNGGFLGGR